jgi:hypothetical protein
MSYRGLAVMMMAVGVAPAWGQGPSPGYPRDWVMGRMRITTVWGPSPPLVQDRVINRMRISTIVPPAPMMGGPGMPMPVRHGGPGIFIDPSGRRWVLVPADRLPGGMGWPQGREEGLPPPKESKP